jgi:hypothetical protein
MDVVRGHLRRHHHRRAESDVDDLDEAEGAETDGDVSDGVETDGAGVEAAEVVDVIEDEAAE